MASSGLNGDIMVQKGYFGLLVNNSILIHYPLISSQRINVYRVETTDIVIIHWYNGVNIKLNISKLCGTYFMKLDTLGGVLWFWIMTHLWHTKAYVE